MGRVTVFVPPAPHRDLGDFWSDLRDELIDKVETGGKEFLQKELDTIKAKMAREISDGVKGEWYERLKKLIGKENADKVWSGIKDGTIKATAPYAALTLIALGLGAKLAYNAGQKKAKRRRAPRRG